MRPDAISPQEPVQVDNMLWEQACTSASLLHQNEATGTSMFCSGTALLIRCVTFLLPPSVNPKEKRGGSGEIRGIFKLGKSKNNVYILFFYLAPYFIPYLTKLP